MKKIIFAAVLMLAGSLSAHATTSDGRADEYARPVPVDSMVTFGRMHSWRAIDRDTLIIWTSALRPYLVELARPSADIRFAERIGVTGFGGRVHSRFDSVLVRGLRYPIAEIYRISPEYAKTLRATSAR